MRGNKAFTLAEVLITLVIIGVIGALTVPALIQNTQKQEYVSALKKAYSTLSQASQQIIMEEGSAKCNDGGWACSASEVYDLYKKHLNFMQDCGSALGCYKHNIINNDLPKTSFSMNYSAYYKAVLSDGMTFAIHSVYPDCTGYENKQGCALIIIDINGEKKPNLKGRDVFQFQIDESGHLFPRGYGYDYACTHTDGGNGCAFKVLTEGAMNY